MHADADSDADAHTHTIHTRKHTTEWMKYIIADVKSSW